MKTFAFKDTVLGSALGASSFVTVYAIILVIYHLTHLVSADDVYPLKYVIPVGIVSSLVWIYCFYRLKPQKSKVYKAVD